MKKSINNKAGVVVYRENENDELEILLVSARKHKGSWVFPVGTVEDHETLQVTAARECEEESGYIVEVEDEVGTVKNSGKHGTNYYTFYRARVLQETDEYEKDRERMWVSLDKLSENIADIFLPIAEKFIKNLN
ncbi:MAG: NUDIX domain-containing protein [Thermodesulfobacteriota bacterium]